MAKLLTNIVLFALALEWIGFALVILFLMIGYWLLGEREIKTLILASVPFAVGIWVVLVKLLIFIWPWTIIKWVWELVRMELQRALQPPLCPSIL